MHFYSLKQLVKPFLISYPISENNCKTMQFLFVFWGDILRYCTVIFSQVIHETLRLFKTYVKHMLANLSSQGHDFWKIREGGSEKEGKQHFGFPLYKKPLFLFQTVFCDRKSDSNEHILKISLLWIVRTCICSCKVPSQRQSKTV